MTIFFDDGYGFTEDPAFYPYEHEAAVWPSAVAWSAILRGASSQAGLDPRHTLLCHLAQKAVAAKRLQPIDARRYVVTRISAHVEQLSIEFGLGAHHAAGIAGRVHAWLASMWSSPVAYVADACWPTPTEWLEIDRGAAAQAGLDGRYTISTNLAWHVGRNNGLRVDVAKRWVHQRIAVHSQQLARELGYGLIVSAIVRARVAAWLDSFDAR